MIKLRNGNLVILGFSDENMRRLNRKGGNDPIKINLKDVGLADIEIIIFHGEDEQKMYMEHREFIGPETEIKGTPFDKSS